MASSSHNTSNVSQDTPITIKISVNDSLKKLKLPLRDLGANVLLDKLRHLLSVKPEQTVVFERFSDSAGGYIVLDPNNTQVFKTLMRAAKAKLKLRLKATVTPLPETEQNGQATSFEEKEARLQRLIEPVIVRSPVHRCVTRDSTAFDRRSVGSGIFQFREARASQQTLVENNEAPVPQPFVSDDKTPADSSAKPATAGSLGQAWSVYCNECDLAMSDAHFHCSICDGGDFDLCEKCVASGKVCPGEGHWLIRRVIQDGKFITSTTERIPSRPRRNSASSPKSAAMPGAFTEEPKTTDSASRVPTRTCNSCVVVLEEREFVTCTSCEDFDLCIKCASLDKHGHHPAHAFKPATGGTILPLGVLKMLAPGRNARHNAICDGCDKHIYGIRHKCLNCPDWDYCNDCVKGSRLTHPRHRFAAIHTPIADAQATTVRHTGIFCDGPLCAKKAPSTHIVGVRYKCAVCHDTDFCASCEASPTNPHNRTHPLIKFKTAVRGVSIVTQNEDARGNKRVLGDNRQHQAQTEKQSVTPEKISAPQATRVQTVAEIKPTEPKKDGSFKYMSSSIIHPTELSISSQLLNATYIHDSIPDGTVVQSDARFTQVWIVQNPGPYAWPSGCSVRFVGGDNMLNVDNAHAAPVSDLNEAQESNVTGREIAVGEKVAFKVTMRAPAREGKMISYWRLKAADGTAFGHRLWCDIDVKKVETATPAHPMQARAPSSWEQPDPTASARFRQRVAAMREQQVKRREHLVNAMLPPQGDDPLQRNTAVENKITTSEVSSRSNVDTEEDLARKEAAKQRAAMLKAKIMRFRESEWRSPQSLSTKVEVEKQADDADKRIEDAKKRVEEAEKQLEAANKRTEEMAQKLKEVKLEDVKVDEPADALADSKAMAGEAAASTIQEKLEGSEMVFPKLEKESPTSSTYQSASSSSKGKAAYVENEAGEVERCATPVTVAAPEEPASPATEETFEDFEEEDDDLEVLSAYDEASEDDGFLTDEEYDVLDASDTETLA